MGRYELVEVGGAVCGPSTSADMLFELGMMYATGRSVSTDLVSAHKWFNLAAMGGNQQAIRYRRELAAEMTEAEIAAAQRAARDWLNAQHPGHQAHSDRGPVMAACPAARANRW